MSMHQKIDRRDAMKLSALGLAGALGMPAAPPKWPVKTSSDPFGGLKVGRLACRGHRHDLSL